MNGKEVYGDTYWGGVGAGANSSEPEKTRLSFELHETCHKMSFFL